MLTTIDKAGRVVIPKPLREAMGIEPGVPLKIDFVDGKIQIEFAPMEAEVRRRGRFNVLHLSADTPQPVLTDEMIHATREAVRREREERWV